MGASNTRYGRPEICQRAETERLVHRHERLSETRDTRLITDALRQCLTERDAAVLDRVMTVHLEVALAGERETEAGMHGKAVQHMVEKADAGVDLAFAALERQLERNVGFLGLSFDFSGIWHSSFSSAKRTAMEFACASKCSLCASAIISCA